MFCAVVGGAEHLAVYRDEHVVAFLDHAPVFPGHTLIVPARHYPTIEDMPESEIAPLFLLARRLSIAFRTALGADGSFIAVNTRISQSVPHLHIHVVPRNKGDGLFSTRLIWQRKKYETDSEMAEIATKIRAAYDRAG